MVQLMRCTSCGAGFGVNSIKLEEERLIGERTGTYFVCPVCGHKYTVGSITDTGVEIRLKLEEVRAQIRRTNGAGKVALIKKYDRMLVPYQREVTGPYTESEVLR